MRATGIVRRIDDLGRVVIPKEIRRSLKVKEGDPLEIFVEKDMLIFQKYCPIKESIDVNKIANALKSVTLCPVVITDKVSIIAAPSLTRCVNDNISYELEQIIETRHPFSKEKENILLTPNAHYNVLYCYPIISAGELFGSIVILETENCKEITNEIKKYVGLTAKIISSQLED